MVAETTFNTASPQYDSSYHVISAGTGETWDDSSYRNDDAAGIEDLTCMENVTKKKVESAAPSP